MHQTQMQTQTRTERNKAVILEILTTAFSSKDFTALDRYLHPDYVQHNAFIPPAKAGLRGFIAGLPDTTRYEPGAIIAEGDLVMVHGRYSGGVDKPLVGIDIFRFEDGLVVEHWDVLQDEVAAQDTVAGNPMFTNPQAGQADRQA
ncbi:nuclear transport factor 2 family protein [Streptomyces mirabilis]|uniref:nuclear transport factor 2 family protein n=1 Tax=Streptomyces mirabilis TaxID=68239 RepID=UPI0036C698A8